MKGMLIILICQVVLTVLEITQDLNNLAILFITIVVIMLAIANYFIARTIKGR